MPRIYSLFPPWDGSGHASRLCRVWAVGQEPLMSRPTLSGTVISRGPVGLGELWHGSEKIGLNSGVVTG